MSVQISLLYTIRSVTSAAASLMLKISIMQLIVSAAPDKGFNSR